MNSEQSTNGNGYFRGNISARVQNLENDITEIKSNHLPHLQAGIESIHEKLDRFQWWLVLLLGGMIVTLVIEALRNF